MPCLCALAWTGADESFAWVSHKGYKIPEYRPKNYWAMRQKILECALVKYDLQGAKAVDEGGGC